MSTANHITGIRKQGRVWVDEVEIFPLDEHWRRDPYGNRFGWGYGGGGSRDLAQSLLAHVLGDEELVKLVAEAFEREVVCAWQPIDADLDVEFDVARWAWDKVLPQIADGSIVVRDGRVMPHAHSLAHAAKNPPEAIQVILELAGLPPISVEVVVGIMDPVTGRRPRYACFLEIQQDVAAQQAAGSESLDVAGVVISSARFLRVRDR